MPRRTFSNDGRNRALAAQVPIATNSYAPIPNSFFLNDVPLRINQRENLSVVGSRTYTNLLGTQLVHFNDVIDNRRHGEQGEITMMLGSRNSYDKSRAAVLAAGATVMICSNGLFAGDMMTFKRKHTGSIAEELNTKVDEAIDSMVDGFNTILVEVEVMKNFDLTIRDKAEILGVIYFEKNMVTPNQLTIIKDELNNSPHFRGNSLWDLYNNITESLKRSHPFNHIENHIKLHKFMSEVAGIEVVEPDVDFEEVPDETEPQSNADTGGGIDNDAQG
jgi:hypothetical protein